MLDIKDFYEAFGTRDKNGRVRYDKTGKPKNLEQPIFPPDVIAGYREMYRQMYLRSGYSEEDSGILADSRAAEFEIDFPVLYKFWRNYLSQR